MGRSRGGSRVTLTRWRTSMRYAWSSGRIRRWTLYAIGALVVVWISWIVVTGLLARRDAAEIRDRLERVQAQVAQGDLAGARETAAAIPALAHRAHNLTSGPAWWAAAEVPYLGRPFEIARGATAVADDVGRNGIPALLEVADRLDPAKLRTGPSSVDLQPLMAEAPKLAAAADTLHDAIAQLDHVPRSSWLSQIDSVRASMEGTLRSVSGYVDAGARTARVLPEMLGADGRRRYFIGLQNEAELRGTGGLPGAFAIAEAENGHVRFTEFHSDDVLLPRSSDGQIDTGLDFGKDYNQAYGASGPTQLFQNSNLSPHFPYAARIWAAMWTKHTGQRIDGAIALDPQVLANLLAATGSVPTKYGLTLSADTVVALTEKQEYALFPDQNRRKKFLVGVLHAVSNKILDGSAAPINLVRAMSLSASEQRVLFWSRNPATEALIEQTDYAGVIPDDRRPFVGLVLNNVVGGKLDYYLRRSLSYERIGCGEGRAMVVTITLTNTAPGTGLPAIVTGRLDQRGAPADSSISPGDNRTLMDYYATAGTQLTSVTIDGKQATAAVLQDRGHPVFRFDLELPHGTSRTIVLHLSEPAGTGALDVWRQPGVVPLQVGGVAQPCG